MWNIIIISSNSRIIVVIIIIIIIIIIILCFTYTLRGTAGKEVSQWRVIHAIDYLNFITSECNATLRLFWISELNWHWILVRNSNFDRFLKRQPPLPAHLQSSTFVILLVLQLLLTNKWELLITRHRFSLWRRANAQNVSFLNLSRW